MPAEFDRCVARGGKVRTKSLANGKYMRTCYIDGKSINGEIKLSKKGEQIAKQRTAKSKKEKADILASAEQSKLRVISELPKRKK